MCCTSLINTPVGKKVYKNTKAFPVSFPLISWQNFSLNVPVSVHDKANNTVNTASNSFFVVVALTHLCYDKIRFNISLLKKKEMLLLSARDFVTLLMVISEPWLSGSLSSPLTSCSHSVLN